MVSKARAEAEVAAAALLVLLMEIVTKLLHFLHCFFSIPLPQMQQHLTRFEDANGRLSQIDISFIVD